MAKNSKKKADVNESVEQGNAAANPQADHVLKTKIMIELAERANRVTQQVSYKADRVLLQFSEKGTEVWKSTVERIESNPNDLFVKVTKSVLDRADQIRESLAEQKVLRERAEWLSRFLKDVSFKPVQKTETSASDSDFATATADSPSAQSASGGSAQDSLTA